MTENDLATRDATGDSATRTLADLEAENRHLRAALALAGIDVERLNIGRIAVEAEFRAQLARSRAQTADVRREIRDVRAGAVADGVAHRRALAEAASDLAASQDVVAALRSSRAALALSEERLSFAIAASGSLGWWDWDVPADLVYAGERFAQMFGVDPAAAEAGAPLSAFVSGIHADDRDWVGERIARALAAGGDFSEEYRLRAADGAVTWVHARGRCYHDADGRPARFPGVVLDITERRAADLRKDALVELGDRLRDLEEVGWIAHTAAEIMARALDATRAGYGTVDPAEETVLVHPDWRVPGTASIAGAHHFRAYGSFIDDLKRGDTVIIDDVATDARTAPEAGTLLGIGIRVLVNVPILVRGQLAAVMFVHDDRPRHWRPEEIAFIRTVADRTQAAVARVQAEEQQAVLNRELSHRLKNTLALVQSIAAQTLRNTADPEAAREALSLRLIALGKAHDILIAAGQESADVAEVVRGALALHADAPDRFRLDGPSLRIGPSAALSLALLLHELATNAAKYGALSADTGHVAVAWTVEGAGEAAFRLAWTESGGPPAAAPTRKGFGTRLIERGLAGGSVRSDYRPEGLVCTLSTPLAGIRAEA
ncbi:HWE histidine kinase domain-containing protein [Methylobacterium sp. NEAU 140]|uniref:sensor histidine kinase n=1 Tax=Methylobacterium sp. NEAU 140 TaxID=3064945 RepID=UPI00273268D8|nr:HWE histidine kinase domain-containing protein [Methylobacterium sp. NEAU 140]MDP4023082.1 HWE histidine kinase domain-containing protein [Methylobacterium sp. NEAU 140]